MSDKSRAAIAIAKFLVALAAGGLLAHIWTQARGEADALLYPDAPWAIAYGAGIITTVMIYVLLSKLGKSSVD